LADGCDRTARLCPLCYREMGTKYIDTLLKRFIFSAQVKTPLKLKRPQKACFCRSLVQYARGYLASLAIFNINEQPCTMTAFPSADSAEPSQPGGMDRSGRRPRDGASRVQSVLFFFDADISFPPFDRAACQFLGEGWCNTLLLYSALVRLLLPLPERPPPLSPLSPSSPNPIPFLSYADSECEGKKWLGEIRE
jgi:hypothetical protein